MLATLEHIEDRLIELLTGETPDSIDNEQSIHALDDVSGATL